MIDPKVVEMQVYNTLPHLVIPVVTDPKKVLLALRWVIDEMEKRYKIFAQSRRAQHHQLQRAAAEENAEGTGPGSGVESVVANDEAKTDLAEHRSRSRATTS